VNNRSKLKTLSVLAIAEGISYLLFGITMPLKYMYEMPEPNYFVGIAHGVLFVAYCLFVLIVAGAYEWNFKRTLWCLAASLIPLATFFVDAKILKELKNQ
jgi:integral membrane protein